MKPVKQKILNAVVAFTTYSYLMLFTYAAASKLLDYETFLVQLGQSPMLSAFAAGLSWIVPIAELLIAGLLSFQKTRRAGLLASLFLMAMFTAYIYIMLHYGSFVPCSCGGILEDMNWTEHFYFNLLFVAMAVVAIFAAAEIRHPAAGKKSWMRKSGRMLLLVFSGIAVVVILFLLSQQEMHRNNGFVRSYPHHPVTQIKGYRLPYNSYYIAGFSKGRILLGNDTAPLHLLAVDSLLSSEEKIRIAISDRQHPFRSVKIKVQENTFYLADGTVPIVYKGGTDSWKGTRLQGPDQFFSALLPIGQDRFAIRGRDTATGQHLLGFVDYSAGSYKYAPALLEKKIDGIFDTDGMLAYSPELKRLVYSYYYRNEFIVYGRNIELDYRGKAIDTVAMADLQLAKIQSKGEVKLAAKPPMIQKYAALAGHFLLLKSDRLGKYESEEIAKDASIIDVYDIQKQTYEFSFYLYHYKGEEIKEFKTYGSLLVGRTENYLVACRLKPSRFGSLHAVKE